MHNILLMFFFFQLSVQAQQPFDRRSESEFFTLRHDRNIGREQISRLLDQFDTDYRYFRYFFERRYEGRVPVVLHQSEFTFIQAGGAARGEYGTVREGVIHLMPFEKMKEDGWLSVAITQQVIRLLLYERFLNGCPRWLYEGAAAHHAGVTGLYSPPPVLTIRSFSDLNEMFTAGRSPRDYYDAVLLSALSFEVLLKRYGEIQVMTLIRLFNGSYEAREAVAHSLGASYERVERMWQRDLHEIIDGYGGRRGN